MQKKIITLEEDHCCGGGHCGPVPGYFLQCPRCNEESNPKTFYPLEEGKKLTCTFCHLEIIAIKKLSPTSFEFSWE